MSFTTAVIALLAALAIDRWWGEPRARLHPVVWMGHYLVWAGRRIAPGVPHGGQGLARVLGRRAGLERGRVGSAAGGACAGGPEPGAGPAAAHRVEWLWHVAAGLVLGLLLKPLLAWRMLHDEVAKVEAALAESLDAGRAQLAQLVSRDVTQLTKRRCAKAPSSPWPKTSTTRWWRRCSGSCCWACRARRCTALPTRRTPCGATAACAAGATGNGRANGRRTPTTCCRGCQRASRPLLVLAGGGQRLAGLRQEAGRTPSPNSGWPMAAMAMALGVRLGKPGVYVLNEAGRAPLAADTQRARVLAQRAVTALVLLAVPCLLAVWGGAA
jgi:adenosylcobinamide-phosphate synthase